MAGKIIKNAPTPAYKFNNIKKMTDSLQTWRWRDGESSFQGGVPGRSKSFCRSPHPRKVILLAQTGIKVLVWCAMYDYKAYINTLITRVLTLYIIFYFT